MCWIAVLVGLGILYPRVTHQCRRVWSSRVLWGLDPRRVGGLQAGPNPTTMRSDAPAAA